MAALGILVPSVQVRILVPQRKCGAIGRRFCVEVPLTIPRRCAAAPRGHAADATLTGQCLHCFDVCDISLTFRHGA